MSSPPVSLRSQHRLKRISQYLSYSQYPKALKLTEELLVSDPQNPVFLSFKSLCLFYIEGYRVSAEIGELAVERDPEDTGNWERLARQHIERWEYRLALRCYRHILHLEPENRDYLRTYSRLLLQNHLYSDALEASHRLWMGDKGDTSGWVYYIVALYMTDEWSTAVTVISELIARKGVEKYALLELVAVKYELLLAHKCASSLSPACFSPFDSVTRLSYTLQYHLLTGDTESAKSTSKQLIHYNCENLDYIEQYYTLCCEDNKCLQELAEQYPHSEAVNLVKVVKSQGNEFEMELIRYLETKIRLKTPAIRVIFTKFTENQGKNDVLRRIMRDLYANLDKNQTFMSDSTLSLDNSTLAWGFYACSRYFFTINDLILSEKSIKKATSLLPNTPDFLLLLSKLEYLSGDLQSAIGHRETARLLEPRDRYLNYKCAVLHLRNGDIDTANRVIAPFSVAEDAPGELQIHETQDVRYELHLASAFERLQDFPQAASMYFDVEEHYRDMSTLLYRLEDDLLQRMTIRTYGKALEMEEKMWEMKGYGKAVAGILRNAGEMRELHREQKWAVVQIVYKMMKTGNKEIKRLLFRYLYREKRYFLCLKVALGCEETEKSEYLREIMGERGGYLEQVVSALRLKS